MPDLTPLSSSQLRRAAGIKDKIESLQAELSRLLGSAPAPKVQSAAPVKKRKLSAAGRRRISEAAKKRWAADRAAGKQKR